MNKIANGELAEGENWQVAEPETFDCLFSVVSTPMFAMKTSFESARQNIRNATVAPVSLLKEAQNECFFQELH